jgi:hypothetical protein
MCCAASARRVEQLSEEITAIDHDLLILVADVAPHLLDGSNILPPAPAGERGAPRSATLDCGR